MKSIELRIPRLDQSPISNYSVIKGKYFDDPKHPKISEIIGYVADYCGIQEHTLESVMKKDIDKAFFYIVNLVRQYNPTAPPMEIKANGVKYVMRHDYHKLSVGWWNHLEQIDIDNEPEKLLPLIYIEEGMDYAEKDDKLNVINPTFEREEALSKAINLKTFMDIAAFFLNTKKLLYQLSNEASQRERLKAVKK